jgi:hypothetical protein
VPAKLRSFSAIAEAFAQNVHSVRVLSYEIGRLADAHDQAKFTELITRLLKLFGAQQADIDAAVAGLSPAFTGDQPKPDEGLLGKDEPTAALVSTFSEAFSKLVKRDPGKSGEILRLAKFAKRVSSGQGRLLRQGAITMLMSFFESLLADLVKAFYLRFPEALPAETSTISLAELRTLGTVEDAEGHVASRAAEALLRENLEKQLKFFTSCLKFDLQAFADQRDRLTEVAQRRNVIVHNNSVVNRIYVDKVPQDLRDKWQIAEGRILVNSPEYLDSAISAVEAIGFLLIQHAWRKWDKVEIEAADKFAADQLFDALVEGRYVAALDLSRMAESIGLQSEERRRIVAVNRAIAFKSLDRDGEAMQVLDASDWSATSLRFRAVVAALRGELAEFEDLARRALSAGELTKEELLTWPAFAWIRNTAQYESLIATERPDASPSPT